MVVMTPERQAAAIALSRVLREQLRQQQESVLRGTRPIVLALADDPVGLIVQRLDRHLTRGVVLAVYTPETEELVLIDTELTEPRRTDETPPLRLASKLLRNSDRVAAQRDEAMAILRELVAWANDEDAPDGTPIWDRARALLEREASSHSEGSQP
jgi:hypothetical protein